MKQITMYNSLQKEIINIAKQCDSDVQFRTDGKLTANSLREFQDKVDWLDWYWISRYQTLSEDFIREFQDKVNWYCISRYQKLSKSFRKEINIKILDTCWLYKPINFKLKYIKENTNYKVIDDKYIEAYKAVKSNMESVYKRGFVYEVGKTYTAHCDCNIDNENSFGLSAWTKEKVLEYYNKGKLLKVLIPIKDIGAIVHDNGKIRTRSLKVLSIEK